MQTPAFAEITENEEQTFHSATEQLRKQRELQLSAVEEKVLSGNDIKLILKKMPEKITADDYLKIVTDICVSPGLLALTLLENFDDILNKMPENMSGAGFSQVMWVLILSSVINKDMIGTNDYPISAGTIHALNQMPADSVAEDVKEYIKGLLKLLTHDQLTQITNEHVKALSPDRFKHAPAPLPQARHSKNPKKSSSSTEKSDETTDDESGQNIASVGTFLGLTDVGRNIYNSSSGNKGGHESTGDGSDTSSSGSGDNESSTNKNGSGSGSGSDGSGDGSGSEGKNKKGQKPYSVVCRRVYLGKQPSSSSSSSESDNSKDSKEQRKAAQQTLLNPADKPRGDGRGDDSSKTVNPAYQLHDKAEAGRGIFPKQKNSISRAALQKRFAI